MKKETQPVKDLYEGAYLMCNGCELDHIEKAKIRNRETVIFTFTGEHLKTRIDLYRSGQATANVALFKFTLMKLKDQMFNELRSNY